MLARVAENLYWLGRHVERAEDTARLVNVNGFLVLDLPRGVQPEWQPLVGITGSEEAYLARAAGYDERSVVRYLIGDLEHPGSILSSLGAARANARALRVVLPREVWELVNDLWTYAREQLAAGLAKKGRHEYLTRIVLSSQAIAGLLFSTMNHDESQHFHNAGRLIERADMTTRIVDVRSASLLPGASPLGSFESIQWVSVLKSLSAFQMYRLRVQARVRRADALRFLLEDPVFPRSLRRCVTLLHDTIAALPRAAPVLERLATLDRRLRGAPAGALAEDRSGLHEFLDAVQVDLGEAHAALARTYF